MFYFDDGKALTVYFKNGDAGVWNKDNPNYERVKKLAKEENWIEIELLHNQPKAIVEGEVEVTTEGVKLKTKGSKSKVKLDDNDTLVKFIKLLKKKGVIDTRIDEIKPFLIKMFENTYIDAVTEIYDFCTQMDFEITKDGNFLAYKNVNEDLSSKWDNGQTKHVIGEYTEVEEFCTDRNQTCSKGLHFCSKGYLSSYGGAKTIVVEIDPRDVVSIPLDYHNMKGRCRRYKTIGILGKDGSLDTTNIEKMTDGKVQTVKTETKRKADKKKAQNQSKKGDRITETVSLMKVHKGDAKKVAEIMNISVETVKRNMRKAKAKGVE